MRFDLDNINVLLQPFITKQLDFRSKNVVLILGQTGSGKSTTTNYLLDYKFKHGRGGHACPVDPKVPPPAKMGDSAEAITVYPALYEAKKEGIYLVDCPGFSDNRGKEMSIATSLCMQMAINQITRVSSIIVIIDYRAIDTQRASAFKDVALTLARLLDQAENISRSMLFIFNRNEPDIGKEDLLLEMEKVIQFLRRKEAKEAKESKTSETSKILKLLNLIYQNPDKIIFIDVFDQGKSRDEIFSYLRKSQFLSRTDFNFIEADSDTAEFKQWFLTRINEFNQASQVKKDTEMCVASYRRKLGLIENEIDFNSLKIELNKCDTGFKDPKISAKQSAIILEKKLICDSKQSLAKLQTVIDQKTRELAALDVSDAVFYQRADETYCDNGIFYNTQRFEYNGIPFLRAEATYSSGEFRVEYEDRIWGSYRAYYEGNTFANTWAVVRIFVRKSLIPENAQNIQRLRQSLAECQKSMAICTQKIVDGEKNIERNEAEMKQLIEVERKMKQQEQLALAKLKDELEQSSAQLKALIQIEREKCSEAAEKISNAKVVLVKIKSLCPLLSPIFPELAELLPLFSANCAAMRIGQVEKNTGAQALAIGVRAMTQGLGLVTTRPVSVASESASRQILHII